MMNLTDLSTPWGKLGTDVSGVNTVEEAIEKAGLDWTVVRRKVYFESSLGNPVIFRGKWAIVREDVNRPLGVVAGRYETWQNRDAFAFIQDLVDGGEATFDSAGLLDGGRRVFLTVKLSHELLVAGVDAHDLYLLLRTSHDGTKAVQVIVTPIRRRCSNQDQLILRTARSKWSVQHFSTMAGRLQEAKNTLQLSSVYEQEFLETANQLAQVSIYLEEFEQILHQAMPQSPTHDSRVSAVLRAYGSSPLLELLKGTGWGALQAVTEWTDHRRRSNSPQARFRTITDGAGAKLRNEVARRLLEVR